MPVEVEKGPRVEILRCVRENPGIHLRGIERATGLALGQVLHHLGRLERMGLVVSARDAGFRRFYSTADVGRGDKRFLAALRHEHPRHVLLLLLAHGPRTHRELSDGLGIAASTLSFHLQRLLTAGIVERQREGAMNVYSVVDPNALRRELIYFRGSFHDPEVDRFVRSELDRTLVPS